jgi:2-dehydropantoate 2-reductase
MVTIVGCGALGSLIAARLLEAGIEVQCLHRSGAQLLALQKSGITIDPDRDGVKRNFKLTQVTDDPTQLASTRLIIVLVKAYSTEEVFPAAHLLQKNTAVLTLQNGLGNAEKLASIFGEDMLAVGVATYGAYRISPGVIGWGGDGRISLGPWQQGRDMSWISNLLQKGGLNADYLTDPRPAVWKKLAINAMVNTVTALTRKKNGELRSNPAALDLMEQIGRETVEAARRAGVVLDFAEIWDAQMENLVRTADNKTSMLQDVESGRLTEIEAISGQVLKYSNQDVDLPCTRSVYRLLKAIDHK